ncbi:MAG: hypothetical protein J6B68_01885 [Lachnospiraceae bacterium]|nr:hypothetical protein [Lachnospiraceae bacterium]MBP3477598.1 hypothetical protein [Lachnospiraceae bacterium]
MNGAVFGDKFSKDYKAIMNYARITPAAIKENYIDIAGGNSSIDLTEAVGGVVFEDGTIEFMFTLIDFDKKESMKNDLHGKRMQIILEREENFYYDGRVTCTKDEWINGHYELYFTAKVKPYKYEKRETIHIEKVNNTEKEIRLVNSRMPIMPEIKVEGNLYLTYENIRYHLTDGAYQIPEVTLYEGLNRIKVSGIGTIQLTYRKGRLI